MAQVTEVAPGSLRAAPGQQICFLCQRCSGSSMVRVATACSEAIDACLPWQPLGGFSER